MIPLGATQLRESAISIVVMVILIMNGQRIPEVHATRTLDMIDPVVEWASSPVRPGEMLLLNGGGFTSSCKVSLASSTSSTPHVLSPISSTKGTLTVSIPNEVDMGVYTIRVSHCNEEMSTAEPVSVPFNVNNAELWWALGDSGNTSTPGGWLRVFGKNLLFEKAAGSSHISRREAQLAAARGDYKTAFERASHADSVSSSAQIGNVTLRLTPANGGTSIYIQAATPSMQTNEFSAKFQIPLGINPGIYNAAVRNNLEGATFVELCFLQAPQPGFRNVRQIKTVQIKSPDERSWPAQIFTVDTPKQLPPEGGFSDSAIHNAFAQAKNNGGGIVFLQEGKFLLQYALEVPDKVILRGSGAEKTSLIFASVGNSSTDAPGAYLVAEGAQHSANSFGYTSWQLEDISIYVYGAHNDIIHVANTTSNFEMRRVTVRANAMFASPHGVGMNWNQPKEKGAVVDASGRGYGAAVRLHGVNFVIENCDIYGTNNAIHSQDSFNNSHQPHYVGDGVGTAWTTQHGAWWGRIVNNRLWNGFGQSHTMNVWNQILFENNTITGISLVSGGQAWGTGPTGGVSALFYHAHNRIQHVWGNDREVMTTDDAGGCYFGPVSVHNTTITLMWDPIPGGRTPGEPTPEPPFSAQGWAGSQVVVVNGTGAGQLRRVIQPGLWGDYTPANRTWVIDKPFTVPLAPDSWIEIMPYRGQTHFVYNSYSDCGAVQLYGHSTEVIVADNVGERITGFMFWGQWRGFIEHNTSLLGGSFGVGANPTIKMMMLRNIHIDQGLVNYAGEEVSAPGDGISSWWTGDRTHGSPFTVRDGPYNCHQGLHPCDPYPFLPVAKPDICMNCLVVLRGNTIQGTSGTIWIGWYSKSVLIEANTLYNGDIGVIVANTTQDISIRGNFQQV